MFAIESRKVLHDLQSERRFTCALSPNTIAVDGSRIAIDFIPAGMVCAGDAMLFKYRIGLRVFVGKRIDRDSVMFEKLLNFHTMRINGVRRSIVLDCTNLKPLAEYGLINYRLLFVKKRRKKFSQSQP